MLSILLRLSIATPSAIYPWYLHLVEEMIEAVFTAAELDSYGAFGLPQSRVIV